MVDTNKVLDVTPCDVVVHRATASVRIARGTTLAGVAHEIQSALTQAEQEGVEVEWVAIAADLSPADPTITKCSVCGVPAHASETDDLDRCATCARTATADDVHLLRVEYTEIVGAPVYGPQSPAACGADPDDNAHGGASADLARVTCAGCLATADVCADRWVDDRACDTCGGSGCVETDGFTARRGHYSITEACPDCQRPGDDYDASELTEAQAQAHGLDDRRAHFEVAL